LWIEVGDQNTIYFQKNYRNERYNNNIKELTNKDGNKVQGFHDLKNLGFHHFKETFKEPKRENLTKILKFMSYFPRFVNEVENNFLYRLVMKEELMFVLSTFQKDKIPGQDGWIA
jgi:hypothetical protein